MDDGDSVDTFMCLVSIFDLSPLSVGSSGRGQD